MPVAVYIDIHFILWLFFFIFVLHIFLNFMSEFFFIGNKKEKQEWKCNYLAQH